MSAYPWRVWFAFEVRPMVTIASVQDRTEFFRGLRDTLRDSNGKLDVELYVWWLDFIIDRAHLWGYA